MLLMHHACCHACMRCEQQCFTANIYKNSAAQPPDTNTSAAQPPRSKFCGPTAFIYNPTVHGKLLQATHAATCKHFFACGAAQPRRVQSHACFVLEGGTTAFICIYTFLKFVLPQTSATSSCAKILCFWVPDKFRISSGFCGVFSYTKKPPEVSKSGKNLVSSPSIAEVNPTKNTS